MICFIIFQDGSVSERVICKNEQGEQVDCPYDDEIDDGEKSCGFLCFEGFGLGDVSYENTR